MSAEERLFDNNSDPSQRAGDTVTDIEQNRGHIKEMLEADDLSLDTMLGMLIAQEKGDVVSRSGIVFDGNALVSSLLTEAYVAAGNPRSKNTTRLPGGYGLRESVVERGITSDMLRDASFPRVDAGGEIVLKNRKQLNGYLDAREKLGIPAKQGGTIQMNSFLEDLQGNIDSINAADDDPTVQMAALSALKASSETIPGKIRGSLFEIMKTELAENGRITDFVEKNTVAMEATVIDSFDDEETIDDPQLLAQIREVAKQAREEPSADVTPSKEPDLLQQIRDAAEGTNEGEENDPDFKVATENEILEQIASQVGSVEENESEVGIREDRHEAELTNAEANGNPESGLNEGSFEDLITEHFIDLLDGRTDEIEGFESTTVEEAQRLVSKIEQSYKQAVATRELNFVGESLRAFAVDMIEHEGSLVEIEQTLQKTLDEISSFNSASRSLMAIASQGVYTQNMGKKLYELQDILTGNNSGYVAIRAGAGDAAASIFNRMNAAVDDISIQVGKIRQETEAPSDESVLTGIAELWDSSNKTEVGFLAALQDSFPSANRIQSDIINVENLASDVKRAVTIFENGSFGPQLGSVINGLQSAIGAFESGFEESAFDDLGSLVRKLDRVGQEMASAKNAIARARHLAA